MKVLVWGLIILFIAFCLQLLIWKIRLPKRQTKVILYIFLMTYLISIISFLTFPGFTIFGISSPGKLHEIIHLAFFLFSVLPAYIITYSAIEVDSPSLVIILKIAEMKKEGLPVNAIESILTDDILVKPRIADLLTDKMAYLNGDKLMLSPKGALMAKMFNFYRKIMNITQEGG